MERLLLTIALLFALADVSRSRGAMRGEWEIGLRIVVRVECRDAGRWELRFRAKLPGAGKQEWMCMTQDWRPCRA